jgi:ATP-dependent DNA ligase
MVAMAKTERARATPGRRRAEPVSLPTWIKPQLAALAKAAPDGPDWLHEIKLDGYRMHARLDRGAVRLLTRTGLDWTHKYPAIASAVASLPARQAYLDGALLLAYSDPDGRLVYAGRAGTGIDYAELERLWRRLQPLAISKMPLDMPPPRDSRFGSPLTLSRVHWVRPELVAEVKFLTWTEDNLLCQVVYKGLREDKPAAEVRRPMPHLKPP